MSKKKYLHLRTPFLFAEPGRLTQSVARLTQESEIPVRYLVRPYYFRFSFCRFKKSSCIYWRKYVHLILNRRMDDLRLYILFNSISVISGQWEIDNERLCAMEPRLRLRRFRPERGSNSAGQRLTHWTQHLVLVNCLRGLNLPRKVWLGQVTVPTSPQLFTVDENHQNNNNLSAVKPRRERERDRGSHKNWCGLTV